MTDTGLLNVLMFSGLMVGSVYLIAWGYKRNNARQERLDAEKIKRMGRL